jgi:hypothetical protein
MTIPRRLLRAAAPALLALVAASAASAQTMGFAEVVERLAAACGRDINQHCSRVNFGGGRVLHCLRQNEAKISPQCRTAMVQTTQNVERRADARAAVLKVCDADARRLCQGIQPGDGNLLECMVTARRSVSAACNQAITDAGYR